MQAHSVRVDEAGGLAFAEVFNTAVPFIDRHLEAGRAEKPAIVTTEGEVVTYAELAERVGQCGNALLEAGLTPGDRLLLVVRDSPAFFYLFWGAVRAGLIPVPLNTLLRAADYAYVLADSRATGLVWSPEYEGEVAAAVASAAHTPRVRLSTEGGGEALDARLARSSAELAPHASHPDDDCFWLYSSGSTGRPKGAVHAHRSIAVTCHRYASGVLGVTADDVFYSAAKLFFAYGFGNAMTFPLWVGGTAVLDGARPLPGSTLAHIAAHRPTLYFGVPTLYAAQLQTLEHTRVDLSPLRACVSAGEALPPALLERWRERVGVAILDGIGSTEALHIFISNRLDDVRPGSSGRVVLGYEARVLDEAGAPVAPGEPGKLEIRGQSVAKYYWNQPEKTAATMVEGWLRTGDTYTLDTQGYYVYGGRSDDMLKVGGIWCSPFEIEARLVEHPAVLEAAVVGRADEASLLKPEAWIVLAEGLAASEELELELRAHCKAGLAPYKYPRWFRFVEALPKTATGKIQRYKLREG